jgi:hypothetical protein
VVLLGHDHKRGAAAREKIGLRAPPGDVRFIRVDATDPNDTVWAEQECRTVRLTLPRHYASAAALSLIVTALMVAGNQCVLPRAVGILSAINPAAIA